MRRFDRRFSIPNKEPHIGLTHTFSWRDKVDPIVQTIFRLQ
jgi:hypothetical protein